MADARHRRTRSYHGRHRRPTQPQRVVIPVVTIAALSVGGVAVANAVGSGSSDRRATTGNLVASLPTGAASIVAPPTTPVAKPVPIAKPQSSVHHSSHHHSTRHKKPVATPDALRIADVHGPCYVQVTTTSGKLLVRRILTQGEHLAFRHHGLDVTLGSAGAVEIAIDGDRAESGGQSGQVRTFRVD